MVSVLIVNESQDVVLESLAGVVAQRFVITSIQ